MKNKFASLAALGMALTLAFGMTVSAAPSTDTTNSGLNQDALDEAAEKTEVANPVVTVNGKTVEVVLEAKPVTVEQQQAAEEKIASQATVAEIETKVTNTLKAEGAVKSDSTVTVEVKKVLPGIKLDKPANLTVQEIAEVGVPVKISNAQITTGNTYMVLHTKDDGTTELLGPVKAVDGSVSVVFYSFSTATPVEVNVIEVEAKDEDEDEEEDNAGQSVPPATQSGAPASPKTGEALPAAGLMAFVCLAGAVICAKKAYF